MSNRLAHLPEKIRSLIKLVACPNPRLEGPCWVCTGRLNRNGYGRVCWEGREPVLHRLVWELLIGLIPCGLVLDHLCKVRACCNPDHLEPVTTKVNIHRGDTPLFKKICNPIAA